MATKSELEKLFAQAATDRTLRTKLVADPEAAAKSAGVTLAPAQITAIKSAGERIKAGGSALDAKIKNAARCLAIWI